MKILVVVDMQNDFVTGPLGTKDAIYIRPNVVGKVQQAHKNGDQVIFTRDTHHDNYLQTQEGQNLPIPHCIEGSPGHDIIPELVKEIDVNDDIILNKPTFASTDLIDEIRFILTAMDDGDEDIECIEFVGVCTGICVISNATLVKAFFPEIPIVVDSNSCACVYPQSHLTALEAMKLLQIKVQ